MERLWRPPTPGSIDTRRKHRSAELRRTSYDPGDDSEAHGRSEASLNDRKRHARTIAEPSTFVYVIAACSSLGGILMGYGIGACAALLRTAHHVSQLFLRHFCCVLLLCHALS